MLDVNYLGRSVRKGNHDYTDNKCYRDVQNVGQTHRPSAGWRVAPRGGFLYRDKWTRYVPPQGLLTALGLNLPQYFHSVGTNGRADLQKLHDIESALTSFILRYE